MNKERLKGTRGEGERGNSLVKGKAGSTRVEGGRDHGMK